METPKFTMREQGELDKGRCPVDGCGRLLDWFPSQFMPGHVVLCCGHHGGGFVLVVEAESFWAKTAQQHGIEISPPVKT
jgi:hypothetical protein